jgi:TPP-dependent pyruvate/acetoin dehydrogenase alpha subunit
LRERQLLDAERIETLRARALEEIDRAIEEAEQAPLPDAADLERYVYADVESAR